MLRGRFMIITLAASLNASVRESVSKISPSAEVVTLTPVPAGYHVIKRNGHVKELI